MSHCLQKIQHGRQLYVIRKPKHWRNWTIKELEGYLNDYCHDNSWVLLSAKDVGNHWEAWVLR